MRYIDADLIEYEPMCRARGNGMYEDCEIAYKDQIDDIPSAQQWIPCTKRLPEEYSEYLVCYTNDDAVGLLWLDDTGESKAIVKKYNILAWMSAPKPYKGEKNEQIH